jgi:beta-galactosidase
MEFLFQTQKEFSLYMAHGGTNFGLTAGANSNAFLFDYQPMITSYDYNATISEQGRRTVKSDMIVDMMNMYVRPPTVPFP